MALKHNKSECALHIYLLTQFSPQSSESGNQSPILTHLFDSKTEYLKMYLYFFYYYYQILNSTNT